MTDVVRVLDERRARLRWYRLDFIAMGLFAILGVSLFYDMYSIGVNASLGAEDGSLLARAAVEAIGAVAAFAWLAYRVILGGHRAIDNA